MSVDTWGTGDILIMLAVAALVVTTVAWWVPATSQPVKRAYDDEAIHSYDRHLVSYFTAAAVALVVGAVHMVVKNLPGVSTWLWEAGYGGHLVRDLANSHIITWLRHRGCCRNTCYACANAVRPGSADAANAALRFTVIGGSASPLVVVLVSSRPWSRGGPSGGQEHLAWATVLLEHRRCCSHGYCVRAEVCLTA